jgi:hypothetical protein
MLPYQGSKRTIAKDIIGALPPATHLYDLFGGGGAITLAAYAEAKKVDLFRGRKWGTIHYNEINTGVYLLFKGLLEGTFDIDKARETWVSREEFFRVKDEPTAWGAFVRQCWSFGNGGDAYLYAKELELYKMLMHILVNAENPFLPKGTTAREKRLLLRQTINKFYRQGGIPARGRSDEVRDGRASAEGFMAQAHLERIDYMDNGIGEAGLHCIRSLQEPENVRNTECLDGIKDAVSVQNLMQLQSLQSLQSLESLERLESLESLESLERLERLERLELTNADYRDVAIAPDSVAYCDIPYHGAGADKNTYGVAFDHAAFRDWAATRDYPVFFSEYETDDPRFDCVWEKLKHVNSTRTGKGGVGTGVYRVERLYWNRVKFNRGEGWNGNA